ncbi:MAG: putative aliphatic sulfonates transport permease protein SsuC, partial [Pseudomonadota bacterium]
RRHRAGAGRAGRDGARVQEAPRARRTRQGGEERASHGGRDRRGPSGTIGELLPQAARGGRDHLVPRHAPRFAGKDRNQPQLWQHMHSLQHTMAQGLATLEPELEDVLRVLGAKRWDVLVKVGLPRSMPYFFGSLKVAITLAFVGTTVSEMTAANEGIGYLLISAGSAMQMGLAFSGLVVVGAMAMVMYELFSYIEKHTTAWAHRSTNNE